MYQVVNAKKDIGGYTGGYDKIKELCFLFLMKVDGWRNADIGNFNAKQVYFIKYLSEHMQLWIQIRK